MNKKILIINGSGRANGFLSRAYNEILPLFSNNEVTYFEAFNESFAPCDGCNYCRNAGECRHRDLDMFFKTFEECDEIYFLSPVYNGTFSAPLKALIDRFQVYYTSFYKSSKVQKIKKHRKAFFISAAGRDGEKAFEYMKSQLTCAFTILNIELKNSFLIKNTDTQSNFEEIIELIKRSIKND